jgi:hypothetical protein
VARTYRPSPAKQAEAEARRQELLSQLSDGIDKLADSAEWQRYLDCQAKFHHYSFNNTLLIPAQMPSASQVASFRKWQELGRNVNKGETSLRIFAPSTRKVEIEVEGVFAKLTKVAEASGSRSRSRPRSRANLARTGSASTGRSRSRSRATARLPSRPSRWPTRSGTRCCTANPN